MLAMPCYAICRITNRNPKRVHAHCTVPRTVPAITSTPSAPHPPPPAPRPPEHVVAVLLVVELRQGLEDVRPRPGVNERDGRFGGTGVVRTRGCGGGRFVSETKSAI